MHSVLVLVVIWRGRQGGTDSSWDKFSDANKETKPGGKQILRTTWIYREVVSPKDVTVPTLLQMRTAVVL